MESNIVDAHLTDSELFGLALPAAGEPEALPRHLSECLTCSRALQEWKSAVRELAQEDADVLGRRSAADWEALEERTLQAIRVSRPSRRVPLKWAVAVAATLLVAALAVPARKAFQARPRPVTVAALSAQDASDDALLRDVNRLARGDDSASWSTLAPEPAMTSEEQL